MTRLKLGVIGAGHLGKIHAKLLSTIDDVQLVAVSDPFAAARQAIEDQFSVPTFADYRDLLGLVDGVILAAPTDLHAEIGSDVLRAKKHLFIEKPITTTSEDADRLVALAKQNGCTLQVGHVERFNPAWSAAESMLEHPKYIEAVRASSFPGRCLDVGVVMDLMIHDIDLVLSLTSAPVQRIDASGLSVISDHEDVAEARITFECGLVANLKASRISPAAARTMQVYGPRGYANIDFSGPSATLIQPEASIAERSFELAAAGPLADFREQLFSHWLASQSPEIQPRNAILDEQHDFVISIQSGSQPTVSGADGARAVAVAEQVLEAIDCRQWLGDASEPEQVGAYATPPESVEAASQRIHQQRKAA
ncbi:Gfo/Idh/MocA family protein [Rosistilla oblonga]|uniref:Gfo/Idh/MocA family protein n=1 Tax=Rosistilla oblonga TaxID=2527990 RepID=UPI003A970189